MRFAAAFFTFFLCGSALPASAAEITVANDTPYEILGLSLEGVSEEGAAVSSFTAVHALPGEDCGERNGTIKTVTALAIDLGRGRTAIKNCSLQGSTALKLSMDGDDTPVLSTSDGKKLPVSFHDLRYAEEDGGAVDLRDLEQAANRSAVLRLGGEAVQEFREFGDIAMPVALGGSVWTGTISFAEDGSPARIRLMAEKSSDCWKEALPQFLELYQFRPLLMTLPDGTKIRFFDKKDANAAQEAEGAREQLCAIAMDDSLFEGNPGGVFTALIGTEDMFSECARQRSVSPAKGAVLRLTPSELVTLDAIGDISAIAEFACTRQDAR